MDLRCWLSTTPPRILLVPEHSSVSPEVSRSWMQPVDALSTAPLALSMPSTTQKHLFLHLHLLHTSVSLLCLDTCPRHLSLNPEGRPLDYSEFPTAQSGIASNEKGRERRVKQSLRTYDYGLAPSLSDLKPMAHPRRGITRTLVVHVCLGAECGHATPALYATEEQADVFRAARATPHRAQQVNPWAEWTAARGLLHAHGAERRLQREEQGQSGGKGCTRRRHAARAQAGGAEDIRGQDV
ncbi:hypothetical protein B0H14DRAFT_2568524 [Mycena olivaceomarginata]|nr:hypothetical protein B0H14DRAFT_3130615 [Mycena olivaceomarginata]KAJ7875929.1 hypothetical protein B0H14DRAFT_2568524 [Mycena olivaceomarginata]